MAEPWITINVGAIIFTAWIYHWLKHLEFKHDHTQQMIRGLHKRLDNFSISSTQRSQTLMILSDYVDDSFGLEAGSLARQIKEIIVVDEQ